MYVAPTYQTSKPTHEDPVRIAGAISRITNYRQHYLVVVVAPFSPPLLSLLGSSEAAA